MCGEGVREERWERIEVRMPVCSSERQARILSTARLCFPGGRLVRPWVVGTCERPMYPMDNRSDIPTRSMCSE